MSARLQQLRDERGQSLVLTLLLMTFLAVALGTVIFFTAGNQRNSNLQKAQQQATSLAEAGINNGVSVLSNPNNQGQLETSTLLPAQAAAYSTRYSSGSPTSGCVTRVPCVKWWGNLTTGTNVYWTLHAKATVPNPTGAADIVKTMSAQVQVNPPASNSFQVGVWNTVYSPFGPTPNTCDTSIGQGITISVPVYVGGNLCMGQNAVISKPVYVGGFLTFNNKQGHIGSSGAGNTINSAHVGSYCQVSSGAQVNPCKSEPVGGNNPNTNIWVTGAPTNLTGVASDFVGITAPKICWSGSAAEVASGACTNQPPGGWYTFASPGPMAPCSTSAAGNPVFDNNSAMDRSVTTTFNLTPATSYTCTTSQGQLSWNAATRVLTAVGTIFFDGSITMSTTGNQPITYSGVGSCTAVGSCQSVIYATGDITINGEMLCAVLNSSGNNCDWNNWNPNAKLLIFASNGPTGITAGPSQTSFQGGLYATNTVSTGQSALTEGPLVSGTKTVVLGQQFGGTFPPITIAPFSIQQQPGGFTINPPTNFTYGG